MTVGAGTMSGMEISDYIGALSDQGMMLVNAANFGGLDVVVPTCPGWRARDLLHHVGYVHRWATQYVAGQVTDVLPELTEAEQLAAGPADGQLHDWYIEGLQALLDTLAGADLGMRAWTFLPAPSPLAFWARRQAHETAIHCADAEMAAGIRHAYPADFAADGIDELLIGFFGRGHVAPPPDYSMSGERTLLVRAVDAGQDWHLRLTEDGTKIIATARGSQPDHSPSCSLTGPAWGVYQLLWNRLEPREAEVTIGGDEGILRAWRDGMRITW